MSRIRITRINPYSTHNIKVEIRNDLRVVYNNYELGCVHFDSIKHGVIKKMKQQFNIICKNSSLLQKIMRKKPLLYFQYK